ncbi:DNA binding methylated-DNA--cysteine S-methyltransferase [Rickenella mellea]|uniref:Methylated-DNA--protein-cysteine methyltransferase n=1 Tax=Rickenella mellea TaxID=50990 RepID=A0A4Y7PQC6_9AGAM|nr:DNA binding methylated-DNA--cysteine S-methyltransferase [Rickenella mellea]
MPAIRDIASSYAFGGSIKIPLDKKTTTKRAAAVTVPAADNEDLIVDLALQSRETVYYPVGSSRLTFRTKDGKAITAHQWAVYDFARTIPCGRVTTYRDLCAALGEGSPRSVGSALRRNPFAPFVPCHRVIASNMFIGGFVGEWGTHRTEGSQCERKRKMLVQEGVAFTDDGYLIDKKNLWSSMQ